MNLQWKHFPIILLGGEVDACLGWLASLMFKPDSLPYGSPIGLNGAGAMFGTIVGVGFAVIATVARAGRDPNAGSARNFTRINGMRSILFGHADARNDGSYVATEWFTLVWVPIFPVCRYRLTRHDELSTP